jgi:DNA-binding MarR family transcriptional regulator
LSNIDLPCACTTLRKASRAVSRIYDGALEGTGITITQFAILRAIDRAPDSPLSRLAEAMVMDRTSLYRTLAPMTRAGWIVIAAGAGRAKVARLTDAGRGVMTTAAPIWEASQNRFVQAFGREDWAALSGVLTRVLGTAAMVDAS